MTNKNDRMLKEKKEYKEEQTNNNPLLKKSLIIGIILSIIIIIISYIIYFNTVLASESIFLNNLLNITDKYNDLYKDIIKDYSTINYNTSGTITIDNINYNYHITKEKDEIIKIFSNNNNTITYYNTNNTSYITTSKLNGTYIKRNRNLFELEDYINKLPPTKEKTYETIYNNILEDNIFSFDDTLYNIENYYQIINEIKNNIINIDNTKYKKKVYLDNNSPIVMINLILKTTDINEILNKSKTNLRIKDNYSINIDMKNNAITNKIKSIKIIIKNNTINKRTVINYDNKNITITGNDNIKNKYTITKNNKNITIKHYKDEIIYSIIEKNEENNNITYSYKNISEPYTIKFTKQHEKDTYKYDIEFIINKKTNIISINGTNKTKVLEVPTITKTINYNELSEKDKQNYRTSIKNILFSK